MQARDPRTGRPVSRSTPGETGRNPGEPFAKPSITSAMSASLRASSFGNAGTYGPGFRLIGAPGTRTPPAHAKPSAMSEIVGGSLTAVTSPTPASGGAVTMIVACISPWYRHT